MKRARNWANEKLNIFKPEEFNFIDLVMIIFVGAWIGVRFDDWSGRGNIWAFFGVWFLVFHILFLLYFCNSLHVIARGQNHDYDSSKPLPTSKIGHKLWVWKPMLCLPVFISIKLIESYISALPSKGASCFFWAFCTKNFFLSSSGAYFCSYGTY